MPIDPKALMQRSIEEYCRFWNEGQLEEACIAVYHPEAVLYPGHGRVWRGLARIIQEHRKRFRTRFSMGYVSLKVLEIENLPKPRGKPRRFEALVECTHVLPSETVHITRGYEVHEISKNGERTLIIEERRSKNALN